MHATKEAGKPPGAPFAFLMDGRMMWKGRWRLGRRQTEAMLNQGTIRARLYRLWRNWILPVGVVVFLLTSLRSAVADWNDVPSGSMKPTILEGDRIFVNKLAYDLKLPFTTWRLTTWAQPQRGDVIVFYSPADGKRLVKRVIGLPGDRIEMRHNHLYVNGEPARYIVASASLTDSLSPYETMHYQLVAEQIAGRTHPVLKAIGPSPLGRLDPITVPQGRYFVMGDNRDNSRDSRFFGFVVRDEIVGKATAVVLSFDTDFYYLPRWRRFFTAMR